jgi:hypothetical protein
LAKDACKPGGSSLLLEEYFSEGDERFLDELRATSDMRKLAGIAERWKDDPRKWAREMIFAYLAMPLSSPGHNVLVKRLFKDAEAKKDDALMGAFLHAFDGMVRRRRELEYRWDRAARVGWEEEVLRTPKDEVRPPGGILNRKTKKVVKGRKRQPENGKIFTHRTRYYLRRRAWRYFRVLGYRSKEEYRSAIAEALSRYVDEELAHGENILDSWCLLNICYRESPVLVFTPDRVELAAGKTLNDLTAAPKFPDTWRESPAAEVLWKLLTSAQARLVRVWTMQMLREHHEEFLKALSPEKLIPLFDSSDEEIQQFAAKALENAPGIEKLSMATWMRLLSTRDAGAQAMICQIMAKYVTPERVEISQAVSMANALAAPVARLGMTFLKSKRIATADDRAALSELANARAEAIAPETTAFALGIIGSREFYDVALVSRFFDALLPATRKAAWAWLNETSAGYNDPALWARLLETPYEDVRLTLVKVLELRKKIPGASADVLVPVWASVLLGIQRGGRQKISALHQISRALVEHADDAEKLLPIMAVAIRSVRPAEARVGLAAVVQTIEANPAITEKVLAALPEFQMISQGATA